MVERYIRERIRGERERGIHVLLELGHVLAKKEGERLGIQAIAVAHKRINLKPDKKVKIMALYLFFSLSTSFNGLNTNGIRESTLPMIKK